MVASVNIRARARFHELKAILDSNSFTPNDYHPRSRFFVSALCVRPLCTSLSVRHLCASLVSVLCVRPLSFPRMFFEVAYFQVLFYSFALSIMRVEGLVSTIQGYE